MRDADKDRDEKYPRADIEILNLDLTGSGGGAILMLWRSEVSPGCKLGNPANATPGNERMFLKAATEDTAALIRELRALPILERTDHHWGHPPSPQGDRPWIST